MSFGCAEEESHGRNAALEKISCPQGIFRTSKPLTSCTRSELSFRCGDPSDRKTTKKVAGWLLRLKLYKIWHQVHACKLLQLWILSPQQAVEQYGFQPGFSDFGLFFSSGEA